MRLQWILFVAAAALVAEMVHSKGVKLDINNETNSQRDEEGLGESRQNAADIVENGVETRTHLNNSGNADENIVEAFVQNSQQNLQGKISDDDMEHIIDAYVENGNDTDAIHITDIQSNITVANETADDKKRAALYTSVTLWEDGIIPYDFETNPGNVESDVAKDRIRSDLEYYNSVTCLKFVPWTNNTHAQYNLTHNTRLSFGSYSGCWSSVGRSNTEKQQIATCGGAVTLHEVGHALGSPHEQIRTDSPHVLQVNWANINENYTSQFVLQHSSNNLVPYDLGSIMHYGMGTFNINGKDTMEVFDNDLDFLLGRRSGKISFYDIKAFNLAYQCRERKCPDTILDCKNNGFIGYIDEECKCVCPDGLMGDSCEELFRPTVVENFPVGSYGLHMSKEGCPAASFENGSRTESLGPSNYGRYASNLNLKADAVGYSEHTFRYDFCVAEDDTNDEWPAGTYCMYRKGGTCPPGFTSGSKLFDDMDDASKNVNTFEGTLPDGVFDNDTKLYYCCRSDGSVDTPIRLPTAKPFQLLNGADTMSCQQVEGMNVVRGKYHMSTEVTLDNFTAPFPEHSSYWIQYNLHSLFFCHYQPINFDCGSIIDLTDTASISSLVDETTGLYSNNMECRWMVRSPENTQIKLTFTEFDIETAEGSTSCEDYLEIMHHSITAPGARYCGSRFERSLISNGPYMMLVFKTVLTGARQGFNAELSIVQESDYNYNVANNGLSYAGNVSYTQEYKKCLEWDKVTHCNYHIFTDPLEDNVLGGHNKCRNPSVAEQPWCYTDSECRSDFCDVAGLGKCFDKLSNCTELMAENPDYQNTDEAFEMCHKSAGKCGQDVTPAASGCGPAPSAAYANVTSEVMDNYLDGDVVTYTCNTGFGTHKRMCLSDGTWSEDTKLCGACPRGWYEGGGACYFPSTESKPYWTARPICQEMGGDFPIVANQADDDILRAAITSTYAGNTYKYYIGANDAETEGDFKWLDGTNLTIQHFDGDTQSVDQYWFWDCVQAFVTDGVYKWKPTYCPWSSRFMCKVPRIDNLCSDSRSDCESLISRNAESDMCTTFTNFAAIRCRRSCGLCAEGTIDIP